MRNEGDSLIFFSPYGRFPPLNKLVLDSLFVDKDPVENLKDLFYQDYIGKDKKLQTQFFGFRNTLCNVEITGTAIHWKSALYTLQKSSYKESSHNRPLTRSKQMAFDMAIPTPCHVDGFTITGFVKYKLLLVLSCLTLSKILQKDTDSIQSKVIKREGTLNKLLCINDSLAYFKELFMVSTTMLLQQKGGGRDVYGI